MDSIDDNLGKAIAGLVVAAIGALTFVAYRHPRAYMILGTILSVIAALGLVGIVCWDVSNYTLGDAILTSGLIGDKSSEIKTIIKRLATPTWCTIALACWSFYHLFLLSFPHWLLEPDPPKGKDNQK